MADVCSSTWYRAAQSAYLSSASVAVSAGGAGAAPGEGERGAGDEDGEPAAERIWLHATIV